MAKHSLLLCFDDELAIARQLADAAGIELLLHGDPLMRRPYVLLTPGPRPASRLAEVLSTLPWLEIDRDPGARVVRRRWWPAPVAERIRRATEAQLGEPVALK